MKDKQILQWLESKLNGAHWQFVNLPKLVKLLRDLVKQDGSDSKYDTECWVKCLRDPGWRGTPLVNEQLANHLELLERKLEAALARAGGMGHDH